MRMSIPKRLSLDANGMGMTLSHTLKNTGTKMIDTKVYDHDFFVFDDKPAGTGNGDPLQISAQVGRSDDRYGQDRGR